MLHYFILCPRYMLLRELDYLLVLCNCLHGSVWSDNIVSMERLNFVYTALKKVTLQRNLQFGYKYFFLFVIKYVYINST